jgi:hypothetical protein
VAHVAVNVPGSDNSSALELFFVWVRFYTKYTPQEEK